MNSSLGCEQIKVEMRRAVVGYCDVTGFTSWVERSEVSHRGVIAFIQKMKWAFMKFRERTGYLTSIPIGDGIIAVLDYGTDNEPGNVLSVIGVLSELGRELSKIANEQPNPRPGYSRVRVTAGVVYRTEEPTFSSIPTIRTIDFLGAPLNLGSRLLQVRRDLENLMTESALELLTQEERRRLILNHVEIDEPLPRNVQIEDVKNLHAFTLKNIRTDARRTNRRISDGKKHEYRRANRTRTKVQANSDPMVSSRSPSVSGVEGRKND